MLLELVKREYICYILTVIYIKMDIQQKSVQKYSVLERGGENICI